MRKVVLGLGISLDGYIARPDGAVDFLFMPKDYSMGPFFATIDTAIMGRKTYDAALKMGGGGFGDSKMKSYVFSHSQQPGERGGVTFVNAFPKNFVEQLRERPGKNIWLMGGGELARDFLKDDVVDELYRHRSHPDRRRPPALPQRLPPTRIHPPRKQDLLERPDRPQIRPHPQKTKRK
jgi:dihydrofolate reductase